MIGCITKLSLIVVVALYASISVGAKDILSNPKEQQRLRDYNSKIASEPTLEEALQTTIDIVEAFNPSIFKADAAGYQGPTNDENLRHGVGLMQLPNGNQYIGNWRRNLRHGFGKSIGFDGSTYEGEFRFDQQHGKGMLTSSDGDKYFGDWKVGVQDGVGTYVWKDRSVYRGHWRQGDPDGEGTWENNDLKYIGQWSKGQRNGKGRLEGKKDRKVVFEGDWINGEPSKDK